MLLDLRAHLLVEHPEVGVIFWCDLLSLVVSLDAPTAQTCNGIDHLFSRPCVCRLFLLLRLWSLPQVRLLLVTLDGVQDSLTQLGSRYRRSHCCRGHHHHIGLDLLLQACDPILAVAIELQHILASLHVKPREPSSIRSDTLANHLHRRAQLVLDLLVVVCWPEPCNEFRLDLGPGAQVVVDPFSVDDVPVFRLAHQERWEVGHHVVLVEPIVGETRQLVVLQPLAGILGLTILILLAGEPSWHNLHHVVCCCCCSIKFDILAVSFRMTPHVGRQIVPVYLN